MWFAGISSPVRVNSKRVEFDRRVCKGMPEYRITVVQIHSNFRGHMEWHRLKLPKVKMKPSCLLWAKWTVPPFVGYLWHIQSKRVSVGACFLLKGFWRGNCFIGQLAVEPVLEDGKEGRLAGHISFFLEGWIFSALQQVFVRGTVWYVHWFIMNFVSLQWWPICDRDWQLHLWHMPESSGQRWLHKNS